MKSNLIRLAGILLLACIMAGACNRNGEQSNVSLQLLALAEKINAAPDTTLANGIILTGCTVDEKDSLFTYTMTVPDDRFKGLSPDTIKARFAGELRDSTRRKLIKTLVANSLGLRYVCTLPDSVVTIVFDHAELTTNYHND